MFGKLIEQVTEDDIKEIVNERILSGAALPKARKNFKVKNFTIKIKKGSA